MTAQRQREIYQAVEAFKENHKLRSVFGLELLVSIPDMVDSVEQIGLTVPQWASQASQRQTETLQTVLTEMGKGITAEELKWYMQTWGHHHDEKHDPFDYSIE